LLPYDKSQDPIRPDSFAPFKEGEDIFTFPKNVNLHWIG